MSPALPALLACLGLAVVAAFIAGVVSWMSAGHAMRAAADVERAYRRLQDKLLEALQSSGPPATTAARGPELHYCRHCGELIEQAAAHPGWIHLRTLVQHCEDRHRAHVWLGSIAEPVMPPPAETEPIAAADPDHCEGCQHPDPAEPCFCDCHLAEPVLCRNCELPIEQAADGDWRHVRTQMIGCTAGVVDDLVREHALRGLLAEPPRICSECGASEREARLIASSFGNPDLAPSWYCADVRDCIDRKAAPRV